MNPQVFFDAYNGRYVDYDHAYGYQCVDPIQFYARWLRLHTFWGNAKDIINQADASYQRVGSPLKGDIGVCAPSPANGWAGHVYIVAKDGDGNSTFGQNYPDGSPCRYQYVPDPKLGFLRPNNVNSGGGTMPDILGGASIQDWQRVYIRDQWIRITGNPEHSDADINQNLLGKTPQQIDDTIWNSGDYKAGVNKLYNLAYGHDAPDADVEQKRAARVTYVQLAEELLKVLPSQLGGAAQAKLNQIKELLS